MTKEKSKLNGVDEVLNSLLLFVKAKKGQFNNFGKYKYRSGEDIIEAIKQELKKNNYPNNCTLISETSLEVILNRVFVKVVTTLKTGKESVSASGFAEHGSNKKGMDDAQLTGSTSTYAKKYSLQNLFQLDESEEDIDGKNTTEGQEAKSDKERLADVFAEDQKEMLDKYNKDEFDRLKDEIQFCKSIEALEDLWKSESKIHNGFKKYYPNYHKDIIDKATKKKRELQQEEKEITGVNQTQPRPPSINPDIMKAKLEGDDSLEDKKKFWEANKEAIKQLPDDESLGLTELFNKLEGK